jgi:hypothetical protein
MLETLKTLPMPSPADARTDMKASTEALATAQQLRADLARAVGEVHPYTLLALARHKHGKDDDAKALAKLRTDLIAPFTAMRLIGTQLSKQAMAESQRLVPVQIAVLKRTGWINERTAGIARLIELREQSTGDKRRNLTLAGVSGESLNKLMAESSNEIEALHEERKALLSEKAALERFEQSRNEADLPDGWVTPERLGSHYSGGKAVTA